MSTLRKVIETNNDGSGMARMGIVLTTLGDELGEDLKDMDEIQVRIMLAQVGEIVSWIGHGDNERVPEGLRGFAEMIQPTVKAPHDATTDIVGAPLPIGPPAG
jgi:hypothetical protein